MMLVQIFQKKEKAHSAVWAVLDRGKHQVQRVGPGMSITAVLKHLRQVAAVGDLAKLDDAALLEHFLSRQEEAAFEQLMQRHGPMVLGVCRRILHDPHDAEDAFQATFLVLVRKANCITKRDLLAQWLYGVACRTAWHARTARSERQAREREAPIMPATDSTAEVDWRSLRPVLDEEIGRLPPKYRAPLVLCYLEGKTYAEAARQLGCPKGTVATRLARARDRLQTRLIRRGLALSAEALTTVLSEGVGSADMPVGLVRTTIRAALLVGAGQTAAGAVPAGVIALTEGVLRAMGIGRLKLLTGFLLAMALVGAGASLVWPAASDQPRGDLPNDQTKAETEKAVTEALERSHKNYVEVEGFFWDPNEAIRMTAVVSPVPREATQQTEWKGYWAKMAAVTGSANRDRRYQVQVTVYKDRTAEVAWTGRQPLDPEPLARLSRSLIPDGQTLYTYYDPDATLEFRLPAGTLPGDTYRIVLSFLDPENVEHRFRFGDTPQTGHRLVVRAAPLDWKALLLPSQSVDAPELLTRATEIANPGRRQFPKDDANDCQARSVWCLQGYQGCIYVGYGDWDANRGPINVWSFGPEPANAKERYPGRYSFTAGDAPRLLFTWEYTVQEESIDRFRVLGEKLVIPGVDGNKANGPDGFVFGNIYIREKGSWRKLSSLPCGAGGVTHEMDIAERGDRLLAAAGGLKVSEDGGLSWRDLSPSQNEVSAEEMAPLGDGLLIFGEDGTGSLYQGGKLDTRVVDFFPGCGYSRAHRSTPFRDGVVYTTHHSWGMRKGARHPLFFVRNLEEGPRVIEWLRDRIVRDILVENGSLYVLTSRAEGNAFMGEIHRSTDLRTWTRLAAFTLPATPSALARLEGKYYIGLANRGYDGETYNEHKARRYAFADKASGSIWRIGR
jgi:RNA polymerase sigma factor (sigma-70 family)